MNLIDPYRLRNMLSERSLAIVGNSSGVLQEKNGNRIDAYETVVRFNQARVKGFETFVGSKTDLIICNVHQSKLVTPPPKESLNPKAVVCFLTQKDSRVSMSPFRYWVEELPVFLSYAPDVLPSGESRTRALTTGVYGLHFLLWLLEPKYLFISGFNFYSTTYDAGYYWSSDVAPGPRHHDLKKDKEIFTRLLKDYRGKLELGKDMKSFFDEKPLQTKKRPIMKRISGKVAHRLIESGMDLRRFSDE